jgi:ubiquinone/menaquinone biosynthesis C-methylase UbiE
MKVNWLEDFWVNSPFRIWMQLREIRFLRGLRPPNPSGRVLEIGCGRGVGAQLIREAFAPARIDAIDIDPRMIRLALRRRRRVRMNEVFFAVGDAQYLPYPDRSMDAVFNFGIIHHLEDWRRGIREIHRVLKPGGGFYFEEIYPDLYANAVLRHLLRHPRRDRFDGPEFRAELKAAGLELVGGYRESRYRILGAAMKRPVPGNSRWEGRPA